MSRAPWWTRPWMWERQIRAYEREDRRDPPAEGCVLFTGSSSIRFWRELPRDMAPLPAVNRGFGGAHADHVLHFAERIVFPYRPRALVFYAGDNDLAKGSGKTPESVAADVRRFADVFLERCPDARLYLLSIKPSPLRGGRWPLMREANARLGELARRDPRMAWVDVATPMLDGDDRVRRELFRWDRLHMSLPGYRLWTSILRPRLLADLGV